MYFSVCSHVNCHRSTFGSRRLAPSSCGKLLVLYSHLCSHAASYAAATRDFDAGDEYVDAVVDMFGLDRYDDVPDVGIDPDVVTESDGYSDILNAIAGDVDATVHPPLPAPTAKQRLALLITRWLCDSHSCEKTVLNDATLSKVLLGDEAKAHIDGIYVTVFGVWRRQTKFSLKHVKDLTTTMLLVRSFATTLLANNVGANWEDVAAFFTENAVGKGALSEGH